MNKQPFWALVFPPEGGGGKGDSYLSYQLCMVIL